MARPSIARILMLTWLASGGAATAQVPSSIRLLELAGDARFTPAERQAIAATEARERRRDPQGATREQANVERTLAAYARADSIRRADLRHRLRATLHYNRARLTDPLPLRLLDRHDPILVEDRPARQLVTMADMRELERSNRYVGRIAGVAIPPTTEAPGERARLQAMYRKDAAFRTALVQAGPRRAAFITAMEGLPPGKRAAVDREIRRVVHTPNDAADAARGSENAVLAARRRAAARSRGNAAALADFNRWMQSRWQAQLYMGRMDGVMRTWDTENRHYPR